MSVPYLRLSILSFVFLSGLAGNVYLYSERHSIQTQKVTSQQEVLHKAALLKMATQPPRSSPVGHRLGLPSRRMTVGEELNNISQTLRLGRLDFQISPEVRLGDSFSESSVELKFQNASDQPLFQMIAHIIETFPGLVYPLEIVMWRDIDKPDPLIAGSFRFQWVKVREEVIEP